MKLDLFVSLPPGRWFDSIERTLGPLKGSSYYDLNRDGKKEKRHTHPSQRRGITKKLGWGYDMPQGWVEIHLHCLLEFGYHSKVARSSFLQSAHRYWKGRDQSCPHLENDWKTFYSLAYMLAWWCKQIKWWQCLVALPLYGLRGSLYSHSILYNNVCACICFCRVKIKLQFAMAEAQSKQNRILSIHKPQPVLMQYFLAIYRGRAGTGAWDKNKTKKQHGRSHWDATVWRVMLSALRDKKINISCTGKTLCGLTFLSPQPYQRKAAILARLFHFWGICNETIFISPKILSENWGELYPISRGNDLVWNQLLSLHVLNFAIQCSFFVYCKDFHFRTSEIWCVPSYSHSFWSVFALLLPLKLGLPPWRLFVFGKQQTEQTVGTKSDQGTDNHILLTVKITLFTMIKYYSHHIV